MDRQDMLALAERCERATGPDRELDHLVWNAVSSGVVEMYDRAAVADGIAVAPFYTASLDAAMALVPEGLEVSLYWGVKGFKPEAQLELPQRPVDEIICGTAETIALALCAAALKARANLNDKSGEGNHDSSSQ